MNNIFYVYVYLDLRKPGNYIYNEYQFDYEPFYVGKGCNDRLYEHLKYNDNSYKTNKIKKIKSLNLQPIILKYAENLIECQSFKLEMNMIKTIGRYDLGLGPLTNLTNGGEGVVGNICTKLQNEKNSKRQKQFASLPDYKNPMQDKHHSEETKAIMKAKKLGKTLSKTHCNNLSISHLREKNSMFGHKDTKYDNKLRTLNSLLFWAKKKNDLKSIIELENEIYVLKLVNKYLL